MILCIKKIKKLFLLVLTLLTVANSLYAQTEFPAGDYWSLNAGAGMSAILVDGLSYQIIIDPKLWLSPPLMVGSKIGVNYSTDNILTFEGQAYLRWNFFRLGKTEKTTNIFLQGGVGMIAAYRGNSMPFDDVTMTRGSLLAEGALGVTIPLSDRWHIEPLVRGGYPHMGGFSLTAGYKFPLPQKTKYQTRTEYIEIIKTIPQKEIVKRIMVTAVEYIIFGPDTSKYNVGIDNDARGLNELALDYTAKTLVENPDYLVRIEGHANPFTVDPSEYDELMLLSSMRANTITEQLKAKGVSEEQMVVIAFGGTKTATSDYNSRNRNRRVELIIIKVDADF